MGMETKWERKRRWTRAKQRKIETETGAGIEWKRERERGYRGQTLDTNDDGDGNENGIGQDGGEAQKSK